MSRVLPILFNTDMVRAILDGKKAVTRRVVKPQKFIGILPDKCKNGTPTEFLKEKKYMFKPYCDMTDVELISTSYNPPYQPGDILYVRETWQCWRAHRYEATADIMFKAGGDGVQLQFANGNTDSIDRFDYDTFVNKWFSHHGEWKPSLFMPKEVARIWLKVKDVRVERLQEITEEQAKAEGIRGYSKDGNLYKYAVTDDWWIDYHNKHRKSFLGTWWQDMPRTAKDAFLHLWNSTINKSDLDHYGWDANPYVWVIEFERCEKPEE